MNSSLLVRTDINSDLAEVLHSMKEKETQFSFLVEESHAGQRASAINLLHYLFVRSRDLRSLQEALHIKGFSTLTNSEGYLQTQLEAILSHFDFKSRYDAPCDYFSARDMINERVLRVFGKQKEENIPSVMVTFKTSFAHDFITVKKLMKAGMRVARINCAHDHEEVWLKMIETIREVSAFTQLPCKIYMDLAGPKMRTKIKAKKNRIEVEEEDRILLTDKKNPHTKQPVVECSVRGISAQLKIGERVFFDDGLIETKVVGLNDEGAELEVTQVFSKKPYLKTEKGINFPDSSLHISALSEFDHECIAFIKEHADLIGYSFVRNSGDLEELQNLLKDTDLPVVLKIETPEAMRNLPSLLFTAMKQPCYGVMIARGDLAVEIGFENISHAQDEILGLCRAAHVPVIYATQILENMNKKGLPTRAEITDAAYGAWADCVMLNKGENTVKVVKTIRKILCDKAKQFSMHHPVLRPSQLAGDFFEKYSSNKISLRGLNGK